MTLESSIEAAAVRKAEARGWWQIKIMRASKRGVPDRLFLRNGRYVWIEFKQPGKEPTRQQRLRANEMRAHGAEVHWCDTWEKALEILA